MKDEKTQNPEQASSEDVKAPEMRELADKELESIAGGDTGSSNFFGKNK